MSIRSEALMFTPVVVDAPTPGAAATRKVYDRSSFEGDFLIAIPGETAEDFEEFAPESRFCEYFDGVIYMPSPVSDRHQEWTGFLFDLLNGFRWARGGLQVLMGPAVLRLTPERKPEPDLFVRAVGEAAEGGPKALLVIEVLSPSNRGYDLDFKAALYREAGIPEVWYVDGKEKALVVDRREASGYHRERHEAGLVRSTGLPGFWVEAGWLWSDPLPNPRECLERILAGVPG